MKRRITENLDMDLEREMWTCHHCDEELISARQNFKEGCLVYARDPREIYRPLVPGEYSFSPNPDWVRIVEFYCPGCGVMIENEILPLGHPLTHEIELDVDSLKKKHSTKEGA